MPAVLTILAEGFEELEAVAPIDLLRRAGAEVTAAALGDGIHVTGRSGLTLHADATLATVGEKALTCCFCRAERACGPCALTRACGPSWCATTMPAAGWRPFAPPP